MRHDSVLIDREAASRPATRTAAGPRGGGGPAEPPGRRGWRLRRTVAVLLAFLVAFGATTAVLVRVVELRPAGSTANDVYSKLDHLAATIADYDVVYVGSSRTRRAFDPAVFEAELAELGIRARSFNLGLPGLEGFAQEDVVRELLEWDTSNLRLLVLAPDDFDVRLTRPQAIADRQVLWHDLGLTVAAIDGVAQAAAGLSERVEWGWNHVNSLLLNVTGAGRLASRIQHKVRSGARRVLGPEGNGYLPNPTEGVDADRNARLAARVDAHESGPAQQPRGFELEYVDRLAGLARAKGVPVVFVREPALRNDRSQVLRWLAEHDPDAPVVDLGRPAAHPELFRPELYYNPGHLNDAGAAVFSELLARELAPYLEPGA